MPKFSQKGYATGYIILFIIVIIFAVMLSGGSGSLLSGNLPSPDYSDDVSPSPTASPSAAWNVTYRSTLCIRGSVPQQEGAIEATGPQDGYIAFEVEENGTYRIVSTAKFTSPKTPYESILSAKDGFNTKSWKINIYSGGTEINNKWQGGKVQGGGYSGSPTGC